MFRSLAERRSRVGERRDEVYAGDANGAGEDNRNVARMAVVLLGLPVSVPAATVNRRRGLGMEAVHLRMRASALGGADVCIAGGVESMLVREAGLLLTSARALGELCKRRSAHPSEATWRSL